MRRFIVLFIAFAVLTLYVAAVAAAQEPDTCSTFVDRALGELSNNCGDLARNNACYGYNNVAATFFEALTPPSFSQPNDRVELAALESITTAPLNIDTSEWGIAVMKVQADIPNALPGQAVTFLLLGDVHLETGVTEGSDQTPMQAIYFTTGIGGTECNEAPESSLIIQGPQDITVNLQVNGANIQLGSTAIFKSTAPDEMECAVIDGAAQVAGGAQTIKAGFAARVPLDENLNTDGEWGENVALAPEEAAQLQLLRRLPEGFLNYAPDVPTPEEVELLAALDPALVEALDPDMLHEMLRLLVIEDVTAEQITGMDAKTLQIFIVLNYTDVEQAERDTFAEGFYDALVETLDNLPSSSGG